MSVPPLPLVVFFWRGVPWEFHAVSAAGQSRNGCVFQGMAERVVYPVKAYVNATVQCHQHQHHHLQRNPHVNGSMLGANYSAGVDGNCDPLQSCAVDPDGHSCPGYFSDEVPYFVTVDPRDNSILEHDRCRLKGRGGWNILVGHGVLDQPTTTLLCRQAQVHHDNHKRPERWVSSATDCRRLDKETK